MGSSCCKGSKREKEKTKMRAASKMSNDGQDEENDPSEPRFEVFRNRQIVKIPPPPSASFLDDGKSPASISGLTRALNKLALNIYSHINSETLDQNVVFSPLSIALALALTETGSTGQTRSEIHKLIGSGKTPECGQLYGALQEEILKIPKTDGQLRIANAFFGDVRIEFKKAYLKKVEDWFKTEVKQVSFDTETEKARQLINQWVFDKTAGKIPGLFGPGSLKPDAALVLVNAVYLKMDWETPFSLANTKEKIFYRFGGKEEQKVQFMCREEAGIQYAVRKTLRIVELPYKGGAMSMYIVLPRRRDGMNGVEKDLTVDRLINLFKSTSSQKVNLQMPSFSMSYRTPLLPIFRQIGFHSFNHLKQMTDNLVNISDAVHMAYIKVDEKGTEAAAVTSCIVVVEASLNLDPPTYNFIADHPFLFFIVHKPTWSIVFMGKVNSVDNVE